MTNTSQRTDAGTSGPLTLDTVCSQLFDRFEHDPHRDRFQAAESYLTMRAMQLEMDGVDIDPGRFSAMREIIDKEMIPAYQHYEEQAQRIDARSAKRDWRRYVAVTVGLLEGIQLLATRGASLNPGFLLPTLVFEAGLGAGIYWATKQYDGLKRSAARNRLERVAALRGEEFETAQQYAGSHDTAWRGQVKAQAIEVLNLYDRPESFWKDYSQVKETDPRCHADVAAMDVNRFNSFVMPHVEEGLSDERRKARFDDLFFVAHAYWARKDRDYMDRTVENAIGGKR